MDARRRQGGTGHDGLQPHATQIRGHDPVGIVQQRQGGIEVPEALDPRRGELRSGREEAGHIGRIDRDRCVRQSSLNGQAAEARVRDQPELYRRKRSAQRPQDRQRQDEIPQRAGAQHKDAWPRPCVHVL